MRNTRKTTRNLPIALIMLLGMASGLPAGSERDHESDLLRKALTVSPEYTQPVALDNGEPLALFHDLNGDDELDVSMLTIAFDPRIVASLEALSDANRLYAEDTVEPVFIVETYFAGQEAIATVEIGRRRVLTDYGFIRLTPNAFPVAITLEFRSQAGLETDLVIFDDRGRISRSSYEETRNRWGSLVDLNDDQALDIVTGLRVPEAGRGYETFVELWEIGPDGYSRTASVPVVRTVNDFLIATAADLESEEWPAVAGRVRRAGDQAGDSASESRSDSLISAFIETSNDLDDPDDGGHGTFDYPTNGSDVVNVIFPRLADNPFPSPYLGRSFRVVFRVECCDRSPRFFEATIELAENPFDQTPLAFLTYGESGK